MNLAEWEIPPPPEKRASYYMHLEVRMFYVILRHIQTKDVSLWSIIYTVHPINHCDITANLIDFQENLNMLH